MFLNVFAICGRLSFLQFQDAISHRSVAKQKITNRLQIRQQIEMFFLDKLHMNITFPAFQVQALKILLFEIFQK